MISFIFNLILAFVWAAMIGKFDFVNLILGFFIGAAIIWFARSAFDGQVYQMRLARFLRLVVWAAAQFVRAAAFAALRAVIPARRHEVRTVALPLSLDRDGEMAALALLLSVSDRSVPAGLAPGGASFTLQIERGIKPGLLTVGERKIEQRLLECLR